MDYRIVELDHILEMLLKSFAQLHISAHELLLFFGQVSSLLDILVLIKQFLNTADYPCARNHIMADRSPAVSGTNSLDIAHAVRQMLTQKVRMTTVVLGDHLFAQLKGFIQNPHFRQHLRDSLLSKAAGNQHLEAVCRIVFCIVFTCVQLLFVEIVNKLAGTRHGKIDGGNFLCGQLAVFRQIISIGCKLPVKRLIGKHKIIVAVLNGVKEVTGRRNRSGSKRIVDESVCIL